MQKISRAMRRVHLTGNAHSSKTTYNLSPSLNTCAPVETAREHTEQDSSMHTSYGALAGIFFFFFKEEEGALSVD